ncbi:unnamed protein product [Brassica oleracea]
MSQKQPLKLKDKLCHSPSDPTSFHPLRRRTSPAKNVYGEKHEAATISGKEQEPLILHRRHHGKSKSWLQKKKDDLVKLFFGKREGKSLESCWRSNQRLLNLGTQGFEPAGLTRKVPLRGGLGLTYLRPEILRVMRVGQFRAWANVGWVDAGLRGIRDPRVVFTRDVWRSAHRQKRLEMATVEEILDLLFHPLTKLFFFLALLPPSTTVASPLPRSTTIYHLHRSMRRRELMRTAFSLPAGRTAKSYVASGAGLGRGLGTADYGGLTRKDPPEIETAAGRATAGRVVPIAIPTDVSSPQPFSVSFLKWTNLAREIKRMTLRNISVYVY